MQITVAAVKQPKIAPPIDFLMLVVPHLQTSTIGPRRVGSEPYPVGAPINSALMECQIPGYNRCLKYN
jgi:hypothetical protein